ncbi:hypothetical protein F4810DRAFT_680960 [Camillea tinctor]|nr:hypothetical protein F4810DRAFT_680960 [Camillea tinctor]
MKTAQALLFMCLSIDSSPSSFLFSYSLTNDYQIWRGEAVWGNTGLMMPGRDGFLKCNYTLCLEVGYSSYLGRRSCL